MNDTKEAIAISYENGTYAPVVVAKGRGITAETILEIARQHGVIVHESKELASLLMNVDLDQHIPSELYTAIAEILAWVYSLEKENTTKF